MSYLRRLLVLPVSYIAAYISVLFVLLLVIFTENLMDLIGDLQQRSAADAKHAETSSVSSADNTELNSLPCQMSHYHADNTELRERLSTDVDVTFAGGDALTARVNAISSEHNMVQCYNCYMMLVCTSTVYQWV